MNIHSSSHSSCCCNSVITVVINKSLICWKQWLVQDPGLPREALELCWLDASSRLWTGSGMLLPCGMGVNTSAQILLVSDL